MNVFGVGLCWNRPVCPCVCLSVYKIPVSVKALAGDINSHLVTAIVLPVEFYSVFVSLSKN